MCFVVTNVVNYGLKLTILNDKPVTALAIAVIIATIVSYVLNREWSFRTRGGRERQHEAALFFLISGIGVALNSAPLFMSRYALELEVPHVTPAGAGDRGLRQRHHPRHADRDGVPLVGVPEVGLPAGDARPRIVRVGRRGARLAVVDEDDRAA